jgi:beta-lactam-binding protein with PASTA domain
MRSGQWRIVMQGQQVQVQRTITLTVGLPETTTVTVRNYLHCSLNQLGQEN